MIKDAKMFECIARRILEQMKLKGFSSNKLSVAAGLNRGFVRDIERGLHDPARASIPKYDNIEKIAKALECSAAYLFCESNHAHSKMEGVPIRAIQKEGTLPKDDLAALVYDVALSVSWAVNNYRNEGKEFSHDDIARATQEYFRACFDLHFDRNLNGDDLQIAAEPALDSIMRLVVDNSR